MQKILSLLLFLLALLQLNTAVAYSPAPELKPQHQQAQAARLTAEVLSR